MCTCSINALTSLCKVNANTETIALERVRVANESPGCASSAPRRRAIALPIARAHYVIVRRATLPDRRMSNYCLCFLLFLGLTQLLYANSKPWPWTPLQPPFPKPGKLELYHSMNYNMDSAWMEHNMQCFMTLDCQNRLKCQCILDQGIEIHLSLWNSHSR